MADSFTQVYLSLFSLWDADRHVGGGREGAITSPRLMDEACGGKQFFLHLLKNGPTGSGWRLGEEAPG